MLDHDERVAPPDEPEEHVDEPTNVSAMQTRRGLVEHVDRRSMSPRLLAELGR